MQGFALQRYETMGSSLLVTLRLFAIVEEWLYYGMNDEPEKKKHFFTDTELKAEVIALYDNYKEGEDGKLLIPYVYNYFAFLFHKLGEKELAKQIIQKIPGCMTVYPWAYVGIESNVQLQRL